MKKLHIGLFMLFSGVVLFTSCGDKREISFFDYTDEEYEIISQKLNLPSEIHNYFEDNIETHPSLGQIDPNGIPRRLNHKATLGRVLFYDTKLSINESVNCASCHKQELAFADDVAFSEGFDGQITTRNSLPLGNTVGFETAYGGPSGSLFAWDEANEDIASQSKAAIISEIEMGLDMDQLANRLAGDDVYSILFEKAYGDSDILEHRILDAIEEFVNRIISDNSRFDHELINNRFNPVTDFNGFSEEENMGKSLYFQHCTNCHSVDHRFAILAVANNGLDAVYEDKGLGGRTTKLEDMGVFKVPFLRNIELTAPYMHDGRFETLREVIDHYSEGIADHPNLHPNLKEFGEPKRMNFTEQEKNALEAYLKTLTDEELKADVKFSNPFKT